MLHIDSFLPDPYARRSFALEGTFAPVEATGEIFPGINEIADKAPLVAEVVRMGRASGVGELELIGSFFRLTRYEDILPTFIHSDAAMAQYTAILYLNTPGTEWGGTAIWEHAATAGLGSRSVAQSEFDRFNRDGLDERLWRMRYCCEMRFNRLFFFESDRWHSPYPREGWGFTRFAARLIQVYFLRRASRES